MTEPTQKSETGQPSPKKMMEALRKSGYLFEHEVAIAVERCGFHAERSHAYVDPEEGKSREVDIRGYKLGFQNKTFRFWVGVHLFIECKDSESPFVFLQTKKGQHELDNPEGSEYLFPSRAIKTNSPVRMTAHGLHREHYHYKEPKKSVQFAKIIRKGGSFSALHENVYDALILPQVKAIRQYMKGFNFLYSTKYEQEHVQLFFNAIVVRDHLFALDLDKPGAEPEPVGRASFVRQIEMKDIKGKYLVDFVKQSYLETYINEEVLGFARAIAEQFAEDPMRFRSHGDEEERPNVNSYDPGIHWRPKDFKFQTGGS
jgi:hypothetical protein